MPSTPLAIRSATICTCSSPPPCSPRAGEQALDLVGADLLDRLLAAELGLVEERVVQVLRHHRDDQLVLRAGRAGEDAPAATAPAMTRHLSVVSSFYFPPFLKR